MDRLPVPRLVPGDTDVLERRARELAAGLSSEDAGEAGLLSLVAFRVRGRACAVDAAVVERAVALAAPFPVPAGDGSERAVVFVDERPLPVADLAGWAAGAPRRALALAGAPALVVAAPGGSVAVAVDGPLELAEDRLAGTVASAADGDELRLAGTLGSGASLVDGAWLAAWAVKAARP